MDLVSFLTNEVVSFISLVRMLPKDRKQFDPGPLCTSQSCPIQDRSNLHPIANVDPPEGPGSVNQTITLDTDHHQKSITTCTVNVMSIHYMQFTLVVMEMIMDV